MNEPLRLMGAEGSPYSRKLRALLRFRRIPYRWVHQGSPESRGLPEPKVGLLPQLIMRHDGDGDGAGGNGGSGDGESGGHGRGEWTARTDTSPLIRELERLHEGRSVIPPDPALAFVDSLLEDYGDEWLTKAMFHYRWAFTADAANAASLLPAWFRPDQPDETIAAFGSEFAERQIGRLWVVGSSATTAPVIEGSYRRLLALLDRRLAESRFLLGARPGTADFGIFGQLTQLVRVDPTPTAVAHEAAIRVVAWTDLMEDLSGREVADADWIDLEEMPESLRALLTEVGRTYVPVMLANLDALTRAAERVECDVDGLAWVQKPFPYQGKCVRWLREAYAGLTTSARRRVDAALAGTGCEPLVAG